MSNVEGEDGGDPGCGVQTEVGDSHSLPVHSLAFKPSQCLILCVHFFPIV